MPFLSQTFQLAPGDNVDHAQLGFFAVSVIVDNPTGQWFYIDAATPRYIAPNSIGSVIQLSAATQLATVLSQTPPGQSSDPQPGQSATFIYSAAPASAASGQATAVTIANSQLDVTITNSLVNANIESASVALATYEPTVDILTSAFNNAGLQNGNSQSDTLIIPTGTPTPVVRLEHLTLVVPKTTSAAQALATIDLRNTSNVLVGTLARLDSVTTGRQSLALPMSLQLQPGWRIVTTISNADTTLGTFYTLVFCRQVA